MDPGEVCDCRRAKKETGPLVPGRPQRTDAEVSIANRGAGVKVGRAWL